MSLFLKIVFVIGGVMAFSVFAYRQNEPRMSVRLHGNVLSLQKEVAHKDGEIAFYKAKIVDLEGEKNGWANRAERAEATIKLASATTQPTTRPAQQVASTQPAPTTQSVAKK